MKKYKKIIYILIMLFICTIIPNISKATKTGFIENTPGPRKYFTIDQNKLSDITLTIVGSAIMDEKDVRLYKVDSKGNNAQEVKFSSSITTNQKNHIYTLSHNDLLKGKTNYFQIKVKDNKGNISESEFTVYVKDNHYSIDDSPRIVDWLASNKTLYFATRELEGIKTLKLYDMNSNDKEIQLFKNIEKGKQKITVDTNKFKAKNGEYKIKILASENDSEYAQNSIQTVAFRLSNEKIEVNPTSIKLDKTNLELDTIKNKTITLKAILEPTIVTNGTIKWSSSNKNVATVDSNGKVTAIKAGTTAITATTVNGKKGICTVKVTDASKTIEVATKWMEDIAANNKCGYNNNGYHYGQDGSYNCIGLNAAGWANAGVSLKYKSYSGMEALLKDYLKSGFEDITDQVNLKTQKGLQRGDVLIRVSKEGYGNTHIEQYCGNGQMVGARADFDGVPGDSSGNEIAKSGYANYDFEYVLRYVGKD